MIHGRIVLQRPDAAGGYKDDSNEATRSCSKKGFTGIGNMSLIDQIRTDVCSH